MSLVPQIETPKNGIQTIEVPLSIAKEVQLFANLLLTGEIDSVSDLFKKAGLSQNSNLEALWNKVLDEIYPLTTRAIFANKSKLKSFDGVKAIVEIDDPPLMRMLQQRNSQPGRCIFNGGGNERESQASGK